MKLLLAATLKDEVLAELTAAFPEVQFVPARTLEEQQACIVDADAMYGWPHPEAFPLAQKLRWIHVGSAGIEQIHTYPELAASDVVLTNGRGTMAPSIGDHAIAFMLVFTRRLRELVQDHAERRWDRTTRIRQMRELSDSTLGILGFGQIGQAIAQRAVGFGMHILAVDLNPASQGPHVDALWGIDRLDDLLQASDYFFVTLPLTPTTRGLIDRRKISLMKAGAHLFVVSRGGIVEEESLVAALRSGHLAGAALDGTAEEPFPADSPLWDVENLFLTPHCSGSSLQTHERLEKLFKENLGRFLAGEALLNVCDKRAGY